MELVLLDAALFAYTARRTEIVDSLKRGIQRLSHSFQLSSELDRLWYNNLRKRLFIEKEHYSPPT